MNISDLDCPQYVCFNSEAFQNESKESSMLSVDSLEGTENNTDSLNVISGYISASTSVSVYDGEKDTSEPDFSNCQSNLEGAPMDAEECSSLSFKDCSNQKENFPIHHLNELTCKTKQPIQKVTIPKPFHFHTDSRVKTKPVEASICDEKEFSSKLRKNMVKKSTTNQVTKVKPFNLTEPKKRKHEEEAEYLTMAEQISAFQNKVPDRYHTSSKKGFQPQEHWNPPPLVSKSPNLQAGKRRRVVTALSREELEQKELEEMKAYEFHAKPVDPKIYKAPKADKSNQPKPKTRPRSLKTSQKASALRQRKKSEKKYAFKARPVPTAILSGTTGLKEKPVIPVTEPKAPAFQTDNRLEKRKIMEEEKKIQEKEKELLKKELLRQQHAAAPKAPAVLHTHRHTEVQPFSFDKADKDRFAQKEKKIQEEIENECKPFKFQAQMMPFPAPPALPPVPKKPPTQPEPFNFVLDTRSSRSLSFISEESTSFKAHPAVVLKKEPFIPEKPPKQIIEFKEFNLHTDKRALEREHLNEIKQTQKLEQEEILQHQKALEEEKERIELMKLRKEIVHKANPIRQFKPLEIKPSSLPLTQPKSPEFETDKRLQAKH